jgi:hypothetical protein
MLFLVSIYVGYLIQNIFIGSIGLILSASISIIMYPTIFTVSIVGFLFMIGVLTIWGASRR